MMDSYRALAILNDGQSHSIDELALRLQVHSTEITNWCEKIHRAGFDIGVVEGVICWNSVFPVFSSKKILNCLSKKAADEISVLKTEVVVGSTNTSVRELADDPGVSVLIAEAQTAGRGRRGGVWVSPAGGSVYLSMRFLRQSNEGYPSRLSLVVGVAVAQALRRLGLREASVKWPNDIYIGSKKLGGVLVELFHRQDGVIEVVVGLGINISGSVPREGVDQPWAAIDERLPGVNRENVVVELLNELLTLMPSDGNTWDAYLDAQWGEVDAAYGRKVRVSGVGESYEGTGMGLNACGSYLLKTSGRVIALDDARLSMRLL